MISCVVLKLGTGHLLEGGRGGGGGWCKWGGVIPFCAPENRGLHKILQPFLRGHVVFPGEKPHRIFEDL